MDYWQREKGRIDGKGTGIVGRGSLDRTKIGSEVGIGRRRIDGGWRVVGGDRREMSMDYYENRRKSESSVAGRQGKGTDSGCMWVVVVDSSGRETGQERYGAKRQDDRRLIRTPWISCPVGVDQVVYPSFRDGRET